ncbi:acyl-CoA dehydrogenase family protein [Limnohabitans sp. Rim8]|uniref:acyl-CoA dehydrogenase family protein n=1 Tax=Limnohabitans sp. Rim8 TaxID=1100718 RepID=UPI00262AA59A|nr:acyl-CoA dehydrogenase family protein [Limnohabitans sp. Rim8]
MALTRSLFNDDHEQYRDALRRFLDKEVVPHHARWEDQQYVDREAWHKAAQAGFLCGTMPEAYGGAGGDKLFSVVLMEEIARINATGLGWSLHSEIVAPYLLHYGTEAIKAKYLPAMARGEMIGAIAMTEPSAGSDLQGIRTTAVLEGDHYRLNGSKTFITNGYLSDFVIVVAKTKPDAGAKGTSLLLVDAHLAGFTKGKPLKKAGLKAQDTCELFFDNVMVPAGNLLGGENQGFIYLMQELPWERLQIAISGLACAEAALAHTVTYAHDRHAFGQEIAKFQNIKFQLADMKTEIQVGRVFVDRCIESLMKGELDAVTASMAKAWCTDMQCKVLDTCVQIHGGYGYMWETFVTRAWADARVQRIYGGTNEIMKELIGRSL